MKIINTLFLSLICSIGFAQVAQQLEQEVIAIKTQIRSLQLEDYRLRNTIKEVKQDHLSDIDTLKQQLKNAQVQIEKKQQSLEAVNQSSNQRIEELDSSISTKSLYWIIAFLGIALLSVVAYIILGKRIRTDRLTIEDQILTTKKSLEEESVKLDTKLTEIIETQLKLSKSATPTTNVHDEPDHSLALKVADEIMRINKNLANMDPSTKGLKQLAASVKRIEDNFAANGYEMPELLNKAVTSGLKLIINNTIQDENLRDGEEIITRIIKPQVNYRGVMIQAAQVEVSIGQ